MPSNSLDRLLTRLDQAKSGFGPGDAAGVEKLLEMISRKRFRGVDSLVRFHEILLFLSAHPHDARVLRLTEQLLSSFVDRVGQLRSNGSDLYSLDYIENSGLAGTAISGAFSYGIVCWLVRRYPASVEIDWEKYEKRERLGGTLPRFLPLLNEDSLVEANIPYREWLRTATGHKDRVLVWLIQRFQSLDVPEEEKGELYDSLVLPIRWELGNGPASRTRLKRRVRSVYYHRGALLRRSDVELPAQFAAPGAALRPLSMSAGEKILDLTRTATTVRYRELYGITHGWSGSVVKADVGRGVEIFLWGLPVEYRLPLRSYHAGITLKNGVPINYIEAITLFERTELGFNTFYTFRDGESAWVYAQVLGLLNQLLGVTCISVDPYQVGFNNDEAIESGAFWFYRKLGFRPTVAEIARAVETEEKKIKTRPGYRSSVRILRRLSRGNVVYEAPGSDCGAWDLFHIRNLGLAVQRRMAESFGGEAGRIRRASSETVARAIGITPDDWKLPQRRAYENLALVLALIPDLADWEEDEKRNVARIIEAKSSKDESRYLRLLQQHSRLKGAVIKLGSAPVGGGDPAEV
jgi:hypothetical protein